MIRLFVYVDGANLDEVETALVAAFEKFVENWLPADSFPVNDKSARTPDLGSNELPDWNLGLNTQFERLTAVEAEQLITFLAGLSATTGRDFVIGVYNERTRISQDLFYTNASAGSKEIELLLRFFG